MKHSITPRRMSMPIRIGAIAAASLFIASCEVSTAPPPGPDPAPGAPQFCPRIYQPVCATDRGRERTFPNACEARADGYRPIYGGECRGRPGRPDRPDRPPRPGGPGGQVVCPMIYQPVCGAAPGSRPQVYSNSCVMNAAGANQVPDRFCRR